MGVVVTLQRDSIILDTIIFFSGIAKNLKGGCALIKWILRVVQGSTRDCVTP